MTDEEPRPAAHEGLPVPIQLPQQHYQPYVAPPAPYGYRPAMPYGQVPAAPYGIDPLTGLPWSDKSKVTAGVLQIFLPIGIGRFYMGQPGLGVAQLLVAVFTCGIGMWWSAIDGIVILSGHPRDGRGLPLKPA
ncbi:TM2 domain-containing protein [Nocardioides immobilis]|uniref:TM2 domain-containing protein n=1 Tax=Nocardioides immobilis TaxID=2049295 RepID=A0A417XVM9_9ACTN|nr:TM2 domain-containing protein [Nocardioides immobilis]RHW24549.1 TM2 domain-containing protein [Nocardioides immobilis]